MQMRKIGIVFFLFLWVNVVWAAQLNDVIKSHFEHLYDTLEIIQRLFVTREQRYLDNISNSRFLNSVWYNKLREYSKNSDINFNHQIEVCEKEFIINDNENELLIATFQRNRKIDNKWYIEDAYIKKNGERENLYEWGLSPLSISHSFVDLFEIINTEEIRNYLGLTKYGKLNEVFLKNHKLTPSRYSKVTLKNVIVHKKGRIEEIIYLSFEYFPVGNIEGGRYKSGWLLVNAGLMSDIYDSKGDVYVDYMLGKIKSENLSLNNPNKIGLSFNLKELNQMRNYQKSSGNGIKSNSNKIKQISCSIQGEEKPTYIKVYFYLTNSIFDPKSFRDDLYITQNNNKIKIQLTNGIDIDSIGKIRITGDCDFLQFNHNKDNKQLQIDISSFFRVYNYHYGIEGDSVYINIFYDKIDVE